MNDIKRSSNTSDRISELSKSKANHLIFIAPIIFILTLLIIWISSDAIRQDKSLWVLFFYSFPAEFLVALVPHEPIVLFFGEFYDPFVVAIVAVAGTLITEVINYLTMSYVAGLKPLQWIRENRLTKHLLRLFNKQPFVALIIAGFTPVPFYPFRVLVVFARYPLFKYMFAVLVSRAPRFYILAVLGHEIKIPDYLLILIFVVLVLILYLPIASRRFRNLKT
jgi:membrane protein YqaA with SNARE-associated domain